MSTIWSKINMLPSKKKWRLSKTHSQKCSQGTPTSNDQSNPKNFSKFKSIMSPMLDSLLMCRESYCRRQGVLTSSQGSISHRCRLLCRTHSHQHYLWVKWSKTLSNRISTMHLMHKTWLKIKSCRHSQLSRKTWLSKCFIWMKDQLDPSTRTMNYTSWCCHSWCACCSNHREAL